MMRRRRLNEKIGSVVLLLPLLLLLCFVSFPTLVHGSLGPVGGSRRPWGIGITSLHSSVQEEQLKNPRRKSGGSAIAISTPSTTKNDDDDDIVDAKTRQKINDALLAIRKTPRGGQASFFSSSSSFDDDNTKNGLVRVVGTITQILLSCGKMVLPPTVAAIRGVVGFYRRLPTDVITTQIGLVYCFAGGYYPTLFSSLQAAHQCGWQVMVAAIDELTIEAIKVIDAIDEELKYDDEMTSKDLFLYQTNIVLKTVDPMKINQAAGALYTTWLGISAVLEKEYARTISLALTMAEFIYTVTHWILEPPVRMCVAKDYHKWIPVVIGWGCKGMAMNIAWRIQRVLTAATSAMFGGAMVARSLFRIISKRSKRGLFGRRVVVPIEEDSDDDGMAVVEYESSLIQDIIGFIVAGIGFYTQIDAQYQNAFSFEVPFPISLITWPFDWAEKWIQWYITK